MFSNNSSILTFKNVGKVILKSNEKHNLLKLKSIKNVNDA